MSWANRKSRKRKRNIILDIQRARPYTGRVESKRDDRKVTEEKRNVIQTSRRSQRPDFRAKGRGKLASPYFIAKNVACQVMEKGVRKHGIYDLSVLSASAESMKEAAAEPKAAKTPKAKKEPAAKKEAKAKKGTKSKKGETVDTTPAPVEATV